MAPPRTLLDELAAEASRALGEEGARSLLDELGWPKREGRVTQRRVLTLWNRYWMTLSNERPDLFHGDHVPSIIDTQALSYLYVREQYPDWVPPLRLSAGEKRALERARLVLHGWTELPALARPARFRLVRQGCPILQVEADREAGHRVAMTFAWAPSVRRVVLVYEDFLDWCRQREMLFVFVGVLLHEELHSAHVLAAGIPQYDDVRQFAFALDELVVTLIGEIAELCVDGNAPTRDDMLRWISHSHRRRSLEALLQLLPGEPRELVHAASELAVAGLRAADDHEVIGLLNARSTRRHRADYWRRLVLG